MSRQKYVSLIIFALFVVTVDAKTLRYCSESDPGTMSPLTSVTNATYNATSRQLYNRLVEIKRGTTTVEPGLAQSWTVVNNKDYVFNLRRGVRFHSTKYFVPSRNFNADDVVFTFERLMRKNHPFHKIGGGNYPFFNATGMDKLIKSVKKLDNYTVLIEIKKPDSAMLSNLAMDYMSIYSQEYAQYLTKKNSQSLIDSEPIGTGPFVFQYYSKNNEIGYRANNYYWKGKPLINQLIFHITPNAKERYQKMINGECHIMAFPLPEDIEKLDNNPTINVFKTAGLNVGYLAYNTKEKPFDRVIVRRALNMAINKRKILKKVYQGQALIAKGPIPPNMWSYAYDMDDDSYNPVESKRILNKLKIGTIKTKLWIVPLQMQTNPNTILTAKLIKKDWAKIGVEIEVVKYPWKEFLENVSQENRKGIVLSGWVSDNGDPDNFLSTLLGCNGIPETNFAIWCHKPYDKLITKAKNVSGTLRRSVLYKKAQHIFKDQVPWLSLAHTNIYQPVSASIKNYKIDALGRHMFETLYLE